MQPLDHLGDDATDDAGTDFRVSRKLDANIAQEGVAVSRRGSDGRLPSRRRVRHR
jgi:hypothetical protein